MQSFGLTSKVEIQSILSVEIRHQRPGYIAQSAAWFADLFDNEHTNTSSIRQVPMTKMSFTIDKTIHFPPLNEKTVAYSGGDKDDGTTDVTEVSLALTMATYQMREDNRQQRMVDWDGDQARENRMLALRVAEQEEDRIVRAEEQKETQNMQRMLVTMMTRNNQQLQAPLPPVT